MLIDKPRKRRESGIEPHPLKIRESLVHIINEADKHRKTISQFDILKTLFLADKEHLNTFGRPITFDEYVAMKDGPVASFAYSLLKEEIDEMEAAQISSRLWSVAPDGPKKNRYFNAIRGASHDILSISDMSILSEKLLLVKEWGYPRIWDHIHGDPAYIDAWGKRSGASQHWMDYNLFLADPDDDYISDVKIFSKHL